MTLPWRPASLLFMAMVLAVTGPVTAVEEWRNRHPPRPCSLSNWVHGGSVSCEVSEALFRMDTVSNTMRASPLPTSRPYHAHTAHSRSLVSVNSTAVEEDVSALLALKAALGTDAHSFLANWTTSRSNADDHCRTWPGVECNAALRVVTLNLTFLGLNGAISPAVGNLTELSYLNLSRNVLVGVIPEELMRCQKLVSMDLHKNNLGGGIPVGIDGLVELEELVLTDNNLMEDVPLALTKVGSLRVLDLQNNSFTGESLLCENSFSVFDQIIFLSFWMHANLLFPFSLFFSLFLGANVSCAHSYTQYIIFFSKIIGHLESIGWAPCESAT